MFNLVIRFSKLINFAPQCCTSLSLSLDHTFKSGPHCHHSSFSELKSRENKRKWFSYCSYGPVLSRAKGWFNSFVLNVNEQWTETKSTFAAAYNRTFSKMMQEDRHHSMLTHVQPSPCPKTLCRAVRSLHSLYSLLNTSTNSVTTLPLSPCQSRRLSWKRRWNVKR